MGCTGDVTLKDILAVGLLSLLLIYVAQWDFWELWKGNGIREELNLLDSGVANLAAVEHMQARLAATISSRKRLPSSVKIEDGYQSPKASGGERSDEETLEAIDVVDTGNGKNDTKSLVSDRARDRMFEEEEEEDSASGEQEELGNWGAKPNLADGKTAPRDKKHRVEEAANKANLNVGEGVRKRKSETQMLQKPGDPQRLKGVRQGSARTSEAGKLAADKNNSSISRQGFSLKNLTTKCVKACWEHGTCNEELGRCDCPSGYGGPDCSELVLTECFYEEGKYTPCFQPVSCPCKLACERVGLASHGTCFDERRGGGRRETNLSELYKGPQASLVTDGRGVELLPRQPVVTGNDRITGIHNLDSCPLSCSGRGVCHEGNICHCGGVYGGNDCASDGTGVPFKCFNQCSDRGDCIAGVCKCFPPYFGMDCSLYLDSNGKPTVLAQPPYRWSNVVPAPAPDPKRRPRIYVYELPPNMLTWLFTHAWHLDWQEPLLFIERALNNEYRVADGENADFYIVPAVFRWHLGRMPYLTQVTEYISTTWPYWNRKEGADHIFVTNDDWGNCEMDVSNRGFCPEELSIPITLTPWGYTRNMWGAAESPCFQVGKDIALPPRMIANLYPVAPYWDPVKGDDHSKRDILLYFKGYTGVNAPEWVSPGTGYTTYRWSFGVRQKMFKLYEGREKETGIRLLDSKSNGMFSFTDFLEDQARSIFCFSPAGWGFAMRTTQAVQMGCIPVVIQPNVTQPFEHDLLDWNDFAVMLTVSDIPHIEKILRAIPENELAKKRAAMKAVWMRFVWTSPQLNPLAWKPELMKPEHVRQLAAGDVFQSIMDILRLRLQKGKGAKGSSSRGSSAKHKSSDSI